ncbi:hypothetical protein HNR46_003195 [Haloferula luteola]|uniref:Uncharacterized protein n=1 Tax=Haloferula luteola TaxID=595692 RepID=A0A840V4K0_9BACT|nr:hypothetical protein [Haloferula luteola]
MSRANSSWPGRLTERAIETRGSFLELALWGLLENTQEPFSIGNDTSIVKVLYQAPD